MYYFPIVGLMMSIRFRRNVTLIKMLFIASCILLFLLKLRFPANQSIFVTIRGRYGAGTTRELRAWEKTAKQLAKSQLDELLLRRCHTESVLPKFLMFKLYRQNLRNSPVYKECQQRLLENEIEYKRKACKRLKLALDSRVRKVKENVSWLDFVHVNSFIDKLVDLYKRKVTDVHKRKFVSWGGSYNPTTIDVDKCIFNFSDYVLGEREKFLLSLGLNFCVPSFHFPKKDFLLYFEYLLHKLQNQPIFGNNGMTEVINSCKVAMVQLPKLSRYTFNPVTKSDIGILKKT